jgi:hypothetical protein
MKSDVSMRNITLAALKRWKTGFESWERTRLIDHFPLGIIPLPNELPVVFLLINDKNWTLITTKRIIGKIDTIERSSKFEELDSETFETWDNMNKEWIDFKSTKTDKIIFTTTDLKGKQNEFYVETGAPSLAIINAVRIIKGFYYKDTTINNDVI